MNSAGSARVVHMTSAHPADDVRIFHKECRSLASAGFNVTLIATVDPYLSSNDTGLCQQDSVRVVLVPKSRGRVGRMLSTTRRVLQVAISLNADLYHFHDAELIGVGLVLKGLGKKVLYDVHEDLPRQILSKFWIPRALRPTTAMSAEVVENLGALAFDAIVAATPKIASRFPRAKTVTVQNYPLLDEIEAPVSLIDYNSRANVIAYIGSVSAIRGAREMIEAMHLLPNSLNPTLALAGRFSPVNLEQELRTLPGWSRVAYKGWLSRERMLSLLGRARLGLVTFHEAPNHINAQPNKLFEYMSAGIPIVASDFPLWREIIQTLRVGLLVNPSSPHEISNAVEWVLEHPLEAEEMGRRGRAATRERFNWESEAEALIDLYHRILD